MRIVVASPPKSGNRWIKCLLGEVYDLGQIRGKDKLRGARDADDRWAAAGEFPDGSIMHTHSRYSRKLVQAIEQAPAHLVTIVRDPYDVFVSLYYWTQERVERDLDGGSDRPRHRLAGVALDHPDAIRFVAEEFGPNLAIANGWLHSERALVVRYEGLHADPVAELTRLTAAVAPVPAARIEAAIEACRAENMRQRSDKMQWHVRTATVGDSRQKLSEDHLAAFRDHHAAAIRSLGYEVR